MSEAGAIIGGAINAGLAAMTQDQQNKLNEQQKADLQDALAKIQGIQTPDGTFELTAPQKYALEHYATPEQARYSQIAVDPQTRSSQMEALQKLQGYSNGAADSELNAANYNARNNAAVQRQRADAATMQNLASRGVAGSGLELAMRQQASQNAANSALGGGLDAAKNNALMKLQGNNAYLSGLSDVRGQDTGLATANANIINQFNMANANERNRVNMANTDIGNRQNSLNTTQQNDYQKYMAEKQQQAKQQEYDNKMNQAKAAAGQQTTNATTNYGAGMTGAALAANTGGAIGSALGNAAQGIYQSVNANNTDPQVEQTPKSVTDTQGSSFTGDTEEESGGW